LGSQTGGFAEASDIINRLKTRLSGLENERASGLFLSKAGDVIAAVTLVEGSKDQIDLPLGRIVSLIELLDVSTLILFHNHPSGCCAPSNADVGTTRVVASTLQALGARLHDHIIVTPSGAFSFREKGLL